MADMRASFVIQPNRGLGWLSLGASLHAILTRLKSQPQLYPQIDLAYSSLEPIQDPIIISLPANGLRLRFDGPDQRLRLIEIIDFSKSTFTYKSIELVRRSGSTNDDSNEFVPGPSFKHLYNRLFGPSFPGEYLPPSSDDSQGTYVLSWPGLAARFELNHNSWSETADFPSLLSSPAASPARSLAIFAGASWPETRSTLYSKRPQLPRSLALTNKAVDYVPDEIEEVVIHSSGSLELFRRTALPLMIILNETTPQDLVAELGPPDAIFRKSVGGLSVHAGGISSKDRRPSISPNLDPHHNNHEQPSSKSYTDDSETEVSNVVEHEEDSDMSTEAFYNYFHHGFDALVSTPQPSRSARSEESATPSADFVVTKVFLHGNIPGSYSFNRHRRSRWRIALDDNGQPLPLTSEMRFSEVSDILKDVWHDSYRDAEEEKRMQRGMILNRGWGIGDSPESSIELLGGFEEGPTAKTANSLKGMVDGMPNLNNTELFGFPGLLFEVLKNDTISCLTVYKPD